MERECVRARSSLTTPPAESVAVLWWFGGLENARLNYRSDGAHSYRTSVRLLLECSLS